MIIWDRKGDNLVILSVSDRFKTLFLIKEHGTHYVSWKILITFYDFNEKLHINTLIYMTNSFNYSKQHSFTAWCCCFFYSYRIKKDSSRAAGDVQGLSVTWLNNNVTNLTEQLSPRWSTTAVWKFIVWKKKETLNVSIQGHLKPAGISQQTSYGGTEEDGKSKETKDENRSLGSWWW